MANPNLAPYFRAHSQHTPPEQEGHMACIWDSGGWKRLKDKYPEFFAEPRNILMGACVDGVNPFSMMVIRSMLCLVFVWYNLPTHLRGTYENMEVWGIVDGTLM
jgi:hypothetical protein